MPLRVWLYTHSDQLQIKSRYYRGPEVPWDEYQINGTVLIEYC